MAEVRLTCGRVAIVDDSDRIEAALRKLREMLGVSGG